MALLYADECFSLLVVEELRKLGHDILTAQEAGQANQRISDADQLAFACAQARAVITFNRLHFKRLHAAVPLHCGIIISTRDSDVVALAGRVHDALSRCQNLVGQLLSILRPRKP
jgi:hypothetical protein